MATRERGKSSVTKLEGYYQDGMRLFFIESISTDGVVLEDCFTESYVALSYQELAAMRLKKVNARRGTSQRVAI